MKRLFLSILSLLMATCWTSEVLFAAGADEVVFDVAAPTVVEAGELFRIEFVVNVWEAEFTPPTIEGFEVLAGPSEWRSADVTTVGSAISKTQNTTYSYVLQGFTAGLHTISAASVTTSGRTYSTKPITIEVVGGEAVGAPGQGQGGTSGVATGTTGQGGTSAEQSTSGQGSDAEIAADQIYIRALVNRSEVYKDEPVVVTLKIYSRVQFGLNHDLRLPTFNGFWRQDISPDNAGATQQRETVNNRVYDTWTLLEYLLYPQQSGALTIEPFEMSVNVLLQSADNTPRNIFDEFMGGPRHREITKKLATQPVRIDVKALPGGAPGSFDGAVGEFKLEATLPASAMNANTSGSYALRLSGTGNFPLIKAPDLALPASFEEYNVTTTDNLRHTRSGTNGYREFTYPFIPRSEGLYTIPPMEFSFFDPKQGRYVTLSSRETSIEVVADSTAVVSTGGIVSGVSREELKVFGQDIRFIKRGGAALRPKGRTFMWSPLWIALMVLPILGFVVGLAVLRRYVRNMQSDRFVRSKRANKVALRRFRAAQASMSHGDEHGFYNDMLKALWGYMGDRLDIPMAELTKERIREALFEQSVGEVQSNEYIRIISECEEAQYSPVSSSRMGELYREGIAIVSELESAIKRR